MKITEIKIRNKTYEIEDTDVFLDNGKVTIIMTKSIKDDCSLSRNKNLTLTKKALKDLAKYKKKILFKSKGVSYYTYKLTKKRD